MLEPPEAQALRSGINFTINMKKISLLIGVFILIISGCETSHYPDLIDITYSPDTTTPGTVFTVTANAIDEDGDRLEYTWTCSTGNIRSGNGTFQVEWESPTSTDKYSYPYLTVSVSDGENSVTGSVTILLEGE